MLEKAKRIEGYKLNECLRLCKLSLRYDRLAYELKNIVGTKLSKNIALQ